MTTSVHETAVVDQGAKLGAGVAIGPYCIVGPEVLLGEGVELKSHVTIEGRTEIGPETVVFPFAALGASPQDFAHKGGDNQLLIGARNIIREHVTMHPGADYGRGVTRVGDDGYFMVGAHVAHDCVVGDHVVISNNVMLAGFVSVGNYANLGGLSAVHQFCRIGRYAMVGAMSMVAGDIIPFGSVLGNRAHLAGLNIVGMKRRGLPRTAIHAVRSAYKGIFDKDGVLSERVEAAANAHQDDPYVMEIINFIRADADRPLCLP